MESAKLGVTITGPCSFLSGRPNPQNPCYATRLIFSKPRYSSIDNLNTGMISKAAITDSSLLQDTLVVTIA